MKKLSENEWRDALTSIYDAATVSDRWGDVADTLSGIVGSKSSILMLTTEDTEYPWHLSAGSAFFRLQHNNALEQYLLEFGHYETPAFDLLRSLPKQTPVPTEKTFRNLHEPRTREDSQYLAKHFGIFHRVAYRLNDNGAWFDSVSFQFDEALEHIPQQALKRVLPTFSHLAKALDMGRSFHELKLRYKAVLGALDNIQVGFCVLRHDGEPVVINLAAQALLDKNDGLGLGARGRLQLYDDAANRQLQEAITCLALTANGVGADTAMTFNAQRRSGGHPLLIEVAPVRDASNELGDKMHGVTIMLLDPDSHSVIRTDVLSAWTKLTRAEAEICRLLVDGFSNVEIAEKRNTQTDTVKSQVASVFAKTGVKNRTELVRLACQSSPPIAVREPDKL